LQDNAVTNKGYDRKEFLKQSSINSIKLICVDIIRFANPSSAVQKVNFNSWLPMLDITSMAFWQFMMEFVQQTKCIFKQFSFLFKLN